MKNSQQIELTVTPRQTGKHNSRAARRASKIPAVLYGPSVECSNFLMDSLAIQKYSGRKFESTIFKLKSDDPTLDGKVVLLKAIQTHPVSRRPVHVDCYAVDMNKVVRVKVELRLEGKPIGLTEGGLLQAVLRELEIECLPTAIPEFISVDVSGLGVGDSVHVYDLKPGEGIRVITLGSQTVATCNMAAEEAATVVAPTAVEGAAAGAAAPAAGAAAATAAPAAGAAKGAAAPAAGAAKGAAKK